MRRSRGVLACLLLLAAGVAEAQSLTALAAREKKRREALGPDKGPVYSAEQIPTAWVGWREFRPREGAFVVQFPAKPRVERMEVALPRPYVPAVHTIYRSEDLDGSLFSVSYTDYPAAYLQTNPHRIYEDLSEESRESPNTLVRNGSFNLAGRAAAFNQGPYKQTAACRVGNRVYVLQIVLPDRGTLEGAYANTHPFFASFGAE